MHGPEGHWTYRYDYQIQVLAGEEGGGGGSCQLAYVADMANELVPHSSCLLSTSTICLYFVEIDFKSTKETTITSSRLTDGRILLQKY